MRWPALRLVFPAQFLQRQLVGREEQPRQGSKCLGGHDCWLRQPRIWQKSWQVPGAPLVGYLPFPKIKAMLISISLGIAMKFDPWTCHQISISRESSYTTCITWRLSHVHIHGKLFGRTSAAAAGSKELNTKFLGSFSWPLLPKVTQSFSHGMKISCNFVGKGRDTDMSQRTLTAKIWGISMYKQSPFEK